MALDNKDELKDENIEAETNDDKVEASDVKEEAQNNSEEQTETITKTPNAKNDKDKKANKKKTVAQVEEKSRILEYLKSEHKWENYVLLFLSLFALVLGCLIINGTLNVSEDFPLIGNFPKVFAWVLIGLAILAILLSLWPFFKPAFPEIKKVTWPRGRDFLADTARVFIFLFILVGLFLLYDAFISRLIALLID